MVVLEPLAPIPVNPQQILLVTWYPLSVTFFNTTSKQIE